MTVVVRTVPHHAVSRACVAAIGNFDGVHRGHQHLIHQLKEHAQRLSLPIKAVVFEPQACEFLAPDRAPPRLFSLREKIQHLRHYGVDDVCCLRFNHALSHMSPDVFAQDLLFGQLNIKYLCVGEDFRFGNCRTGDHEVLKKHANTHSATVDVRPTLTHQHEKISSTRVRGALQRGDCEQAKLLLGHYYSVSGRVTYGQGLARQWGIPTANIPMNRRELPVWGVFCVLVAIPGEPLHRGVANMGLRPTLHGKQRVLEVHVFDLNRSLYGQRMTVYFVHRLRDEIKFASIDALRTQLMQDVVQAQEFFTTQDQDTVLDHTLLIPSTYAYV